MVNISKILLASLLICRIATQFAQAYHESMTNSTDAMDGPLSENEVDCSNLCAYRCSRSGRLKICLRACKTCCAHCNCVPPGTSGNKEVCPCYADMKTHGGRPKCP